MYVSGVEENAYQIIRYMVETGAKTFSWGSVRQELGLTQEEFGAAYNYLYGNNCCHAAGQLGDGATILIDKGGYPFYSQLKEQRINLPREAEILLKFLVKAHRPDFSLSGADAVMKALGWDNNLYMEAAQVLGDEGFVKGQSADNNPFWLISVTSEGRKAVRSDFRRPEKVAGAIHTGNITTNIQGNNNQLSIGSILTAASQTIQVTSALEAKEKDEIKDLLDQLQQHLQEVPDDRADDAEAVAEMARSFVEGATKEKPNKKVLEITADGLKKAAENIASITPQVLTTALAIISFIDKLPR